jgi:hypothetical protein
MTFTRFDKRLDRKGTRWGPKRADLGSARTDEPRASETHNGVFADGHFMLTRSQGLFSVFVKITVKRGE